MGAPPVTAVAREQGLRHSLTGGQMSMIAIGGAIGTGLFLGSGFAIGMAGPAVLLSYAVGGLIALLLMAALAEMTTAHPTTGSFGAYAEAYLGPWAGFLVRYAYWSCVVLAVGTEVTAVAEYMKYWLPQAPGWWWILGFSAALIAVNAASVQVFGWVEYAFSAVKIAAIVAFIVVGAAVVFRARPGSGVGFVNYVDHGGFFPHGLWGAWTAVIIAIFSYLSLEAIAVAAGEAADPKRAVAQAFRATLLRLVLFYLASLALMLAITPWTQAGAGGSPFVIAMRATHVPYAAGVINFVVLVAALSAMNSQLYVTSRMMFSLARAGDAPKAFGWLTSGGVPLPALAVSSLGVAVGTAVYLARPDTAFTVMIAISMFGAMFTWMMIFITHLAFRARTSAETLSFRAWGHPVGSLAGAGLMAAVLVTTAFTRQFRLTLAYGIPVLVLLSAAYLVKRRMAQRP